MCNADRIKVLNMYVGVYHSKYEYVMNFFSRFLRAKFNRYKQAITWHNKQESTSAWFENSGLNVC